jgi:hypothetical protein
MITRRADRTVMRKHLSADRSADPVNPLGITGRKWRVVPKNFRPEMPARLHTVLTPPDRLTVFRVPLT